jgi:hypothetical protein
MDAGDRFDHDARRPVVALPTCGERHQAGVEAVARQLSVSRRAEP